MASRLPLRQLGRLTVTTRNRACLVRADHNPWRSFHSIPALRAPVEAPEYLSEGERKIFNIVQENLKPTKLEVQDVSGGCGSMYALDIVSDQFQGLSMIKQHRLVNKILGEEIKKWHGVQLKTKAP